MGSMRLSRSVLRGLLVVLLAGASCCAAELPVWRYWRVGDGLAELYTGHVSIDGPQKVVIAHGSVPKAETFDGYQMNQWEAPDYAGGIHSASG